ncbi:phage holin family protein [Deltaproteobacteria bacterium OttesenSCG-928-M10]|nr:phage holin family protein [Deltaproteobacteria bacterium OttesenSCG-928-M10]
MTGLSLKDLAFQVTYYFGQIWAGWQVKVPLSIFTGFYVNHLGGDAAALVTWFSLVVVDLAFGAWLAVRRRRFDVRAFGRWAVKVATHCLVIIIAGLAFRSVLLPMGLTIPLLDLTLGLLVCTEALSILKNMQRLGLPVPKLAVRLIGGLSGKAEDKIEDFFNRPANDRRRPQRPNHDHADQD